MKDKRFQMENAQNGEKQPKWKCMKKEVKD